MAEAPNEAGAYDDLFTSLHDGVLRYAYLLVGDREIARDLTAEAFARMLVPWRRRTVEQPEAYVRRIVLNLVRDGHRRSVGRDVRERLASRSEEEPSFDTPIAQRVSLLAALATLPPRQRAVVVLRFYEGRTEADIASVLGVRVGTVKSTLSRALDRLRGSLASEGEMQ